MVAHVRLGSKFQIVIPQALRDLHGWTAGQELLIMDTPRGLTITPVQPLSALVGIAAGADPFIRDRSDVEQP